MASCANSVSRSVKPPSASTWCEDRHAFVELAEFSCTTKQSGIAAIDMFVVASATFRLLFVAHPGSRPQEDCTLRCHAASDRRLVFAPGDRSIPAGHRAALFAARSRRLVRPGFPQPGRCVGITEIVTAPRSPWQNFYIERVIGSIRRECLDHIVVFNEPLQSNSLARSSCTTSKFRFRL